MGTLSAFFDQSGHTDRELVCFGGVSSYNEHFNPFADEWGRLLLRNGIEVLSAKTAFNIRRPLSKKNPRIGAVDRIEDLSTFIRCIRRHLLVITALSIDTKAFMELPSHFYQSYGNDPQFVAFARSLLQVVGFTHDRDKVIFTCDDDEKLGVHLFRLYRKIKKIYPEMRGKLAAISFADDRFLFALQAADLVAGLIRLETTRKFFNREYELAPLYGVLSKDPDQNNEKLWELQIGFGDKQALINISQGLTSERDKQLKHAKERQSRFRELRLHNEGPNEGSTQRNKSQTRRGKEGQREEEI